MMDWNELTRVDDTRAVCSWAPGLRTTAPGRLGFLLMDWNELTGVDDTRAVCPVGSGLRTTMPPGRTFFSSPTPAGGRGRVFAGSISAASAASAACAARAACAACAVSAAPGLRPGIFGTTAGLPASVSLTARRPPAASTASGSPEQRGLPPAGAAQHGARPF